jgi:hypothetical protein
VLRGHPVRGDQTSAQELVLAKPLKASQKLSLQSSGLSIIEKTSSANVKISRGRASSTSTGGGGLVQAPTHALDLFDLGSSASGDEAAAPMPRQKCPRENLLLRWLS